MTLLGRIFVGIIFVFSLVFLGLALALTATHRNWRDLVIGKNGYKEQVAQRDREITKLNADLLEIKNDLNLEQSARRTALAALQTKVSQYEQQLFNAQQLVEKLQGENSSLAQTDQQRAEELARLSQDNANLRTQILAERQERDDLFVKATQVTDQLNLYRGIHDNLEERNKQLVAQLTQYKEVIDKLGVNPNDPLHGAPPEVNGEVLVVNQPTNEIEVSIGYDEGIRKGHFLEVTRGGRYLGKVRVTKTAADRAVAEILKDYRLGTIQKGDRVDTTID